MTGIPPQEDKMDLKERFPVDPRKASDGVDVKIGGTTFKLAYAGSSKATLVLHAHTQRLAATMSAEDAGIEAMRITLVDTVVLGWKGLKEDGKAVKYSKETLARILKEYEGLDLTLMNAAADVSDFRKKQKEKTEKNS